MENFGATFSIIIWTWTQLRDFLISFQVQDMDAKEKSPTSTGVHVNSSELGVGLEEDKPLDGVLGLVTISTLFRSFSKASKVRTIGKARLDLHNLLRHFNNEIFLRFLALTRGMVLDLVYLKPILRLTLPFSNA